ncbi:MAG: 3-dehydroquinate synthase [Candidatus Omnitrophica bacterium]|nr:3-dehydroquinate synthase [Candidatus Omnitrophota bacterium]
MRKIRVSLKERSYDIVIGGHSYANLGKFIKVLDIGRDALVVTNRKILSIFGSDIKRSLKECNLSVHFEVVPDSEKAKSFPVLASLIKKIAAYDRDKSIFFVALGGGVIGDLTGFVSSVYKRGLPHIVVPTTLLAQVDSAIGGKTAIDLPYGKNLIGSFYQPRLVFSAVSALSTLPLRQIRNGLAEVIKYGVIKDKKLFEYLEKGYSDKYKRKDVHSFDWEYIVEVCSRIKARIIERDEKDNRDVRVILNFGHTIGHGIEAAAGYNKRYNHGEAIALGMLAASYVGQELGITEPNTVVRLESLIRDVGLPHRIAGIKANRIKNAVYYDKKFRGKVNRMVIPSEIGMVTIKRNIPPELIFKIIKKMCI